MGASFFLPKGPQGHKEIWKWNMKSEHSFAKSAKTRSREVERERLVNSVGGLGFTS
jgi:hypothetical protein